MLYKQLQIITLLGVCLRLSYLIHVKVGWASKVRCSSFLSLAWTFPQFKGSCCHLLGETSLMHVPSISRASGGSVPLAEQASPGSQLRHQPTDALGLGFSAPPGMIPFLIPG